MAWKLYIPFKREQQYSKAADCVRQGFGSQISAARNFDFSRERASAYFQMLTSNSKLFRTLCRPNKYICWAKSGPWARLQLCPGVGYTETAWALSSRMEH